MTTPEFATKRLLLRGVSPNDVDSYTKHFVDYEVIRNLAAKVPWPYPENGVADYIRDVILPLQGVSRWDWGLFAQEAPSEMIDAWVLPRALNRRTVARSSKGERLSRVRDVKREDGAP